MVDEAARAGHGRVSRRLVSDWADQGLLGDPRRTSRGVGGGRGARYEWSEAQCRLFLLLLERRKTLPAMGGLGGLCDIPVGFWLYWAVDWIEIDQVQRALATWWRRTSSTNEDTSLAQARKFVHSFVPKGAPREATNALRDELQESMRRGRFDADKLKRLAAAALVRSGGRSKWMTQDPSGAIDAMLSTVTAMERYDEATPADFLYARARLRRIAGDYVRLWDELHGRPGGEAFETPTWEFFTTNSCRHLITGIGEQLRAQRGGRRLPAVDLVPANTIPVEFTILPIREPIPMGDEPTTRGATGG
jgi:hypothetical protein